MNTEEKYKKGTASLSPLELLIVFSTSKINLKVIMADDEKRNDASETRHLVECKHNIMDWYQENVSLFAPPVCNKLMHKKQVPYSSNITIADWKKKKTFNSNMFDDLFHDLC